MLNQKIAYVNLSDKKIEIKEIPIELIKKFLGARGINSYLLYNRVDDKTDPLGPDNCLIVGCGLLTGIKGLSLARCTITGKSPESGILGDANIGGSFGAAMQRCGIGYLLVKGKAGQPVYILIEDDAVSIKDAKDLWGKNTVETGEMLKQKHTDKSASLVIGPAGEKLIRFAGVFTGKKNTAARCGMGCVMGSKNLKAIVALGSKELEPKDKEGFNNCVVELNKKLNEEFLTKRLKEFGTMNLYEIINENIGMGRTYNDLTSVFKENKEISHTNLKEKYYTGKAGCKPCPIACQHKYEIKEGVYKGVKNEGPEYGVVAHLGPVLGIKKLEPILKMNQMLNEFGMDASSTANIIAWMIELYQRKIIDDKITGGMKLEWGNEKQVIELVPMIAKRKGFGDLLANGAREIAEKLPAEAKDYMIWIKNLPQSDPADLRYINAFALGDSVATRGADHLRSRPIWEAFGYPEEELAKIYGGPVSSDHRSYKGKGRVVWWWESYVTLFDCTGLCKLLAFHSMPGVFDFDLFARLISTATGLNLTAQQVFEVGERVNLIERMFLAREGLTRKDDYPPERYFKPLERQDDLYQEDKGLHLIKEDYEKMLDEYYQLRGCDKNGIPTSEAKERLILSDEPSHLI